MCPMLYAPLPYEVGLAFRDDPVGAPFREWGEGHGATRVPLDWQA